MAYQPIENYGIIGDMHTAALVGMNGSIDWLCFPHFDSPSVFAAILDDRKGGYYKISTVEAEITHKQFYWPETNVLVTRFLSTDGVGELTDFMVVDQAASENEHHRHRLIRRVRAVRGDMKFHMVCRPAFNYARDAHRLKITPEGAVFYSANLNLGLATGVPLQQDEDRVGVLADFTLSEGESAVFLLQGIEPGATGDACMSTEEAHDAFIKTVTYWRRWISGCTYAGRWRETVHRSALVLKLLTYKPTGAIIAAPTAGLPEVIGGERNWDYRYTWIRDAAFTLYGLLRIGFTEEATAFMQWLEARCHEPNPDGSLQIMYSIDGHHQLKEENLEHLDGYKASRPVRIGNDAFKQLQLDIYGELMDSVYLFNKYGNPISYELWIHLRRLIDYVCENWGRKDEGIWEVRGARRHFVYSKLMCWVALDRGLRLADKRSFPTDRNRWQKVRDQIYEEIMSRGWNKECQAFVQFYESNTLDASNLIMPLIFFLSPTDPRMLKTLRAILRPLREGGLVSNSLVYRYNAAESADGLSGKEGTFNMCTFWLVEALTRAGRVDPKKLDDARLIFEQMLGYANHLGLYAEETGSCGEALGNFPQAFTHIALISSAFNLDRALGRKF